jgi:alkanesulfonate monooxygenase SsuD/methylene tetrahydromethanopterin reductase-like flavin-dependent oxidoreductase (luciferase family)
VEHPFERLYAQAIDQIVEAERLGFDSIWITEHHFCEDGYTPSPLVMAAAIGARTRRMRLGTNLMILPLHNPVRIAEDAATLSLLTGGRFDLGVGIGYRELEFREFGRELKQRPSLIEEGIAIIRKAWAGERINFQGKRFKVGDSGSRRHPSTRRGSSSAAWLSRRSTVPLASPTDSCRRAASGRMSTWSASSGTARRRRTA